MRRLSDEEAEALGKEIFCMADPEYADGTFTMPPHMLQSMGRAAYKLCLPLVVGNMEASQAMLDAGDRAYCNFDPLAERDLKETIWEAMLTVLREEVENGE